MAPTSDQIQADIARTRARMATGLDNAGRSVAVRRPSDGGSTVTASVGQQVREHPLLTIGLSLLAGSMLKDYFGGSASADRPQFGRPTPETRYQSASRPSYGQFHTTDAVRGVAHDVADTTAHAARQVADTATGVVDQVGDAASEVADRASDLLSTITSTLNEQVQQRPVATIAVSLLAGSLLKDYFTGSPAGAPRTTYAPGSGGRRQYGYGQTESVGQSAGRAVDRLGDAASGAAEQTREAAGAAVDVARDAAGNVVDATKEVAVNVADATKEVAGNVADATVDVANRVVDVTSDAAHEIVSTTTEVAGELRDRTGDLLYTASQQVQRRPLTTVALALGAGMLLQPALQPRVSDLVESVGRPVRQIGRSVAALVELPAPPEVAQIRTRLVPATVDRAKQFTDRELREYLDHALEGVVGQSSLRAGLVAAVTEKAEALAESRLPDVLDRSLQGTPGLLILALTGAVLRARGQAQQGQGQTIANVKTELAQSLTQTAREQLMAHFPAFREQYQAGQPAPIKCPHCGMEVAANARFCPACGQPVQQPGT